MKKQKLLSRSLVILAVSALAAAVSRADKTVTYKDLVSRLTDLERLARPVVDGEKTFASTSHDRGAKYNAEKDRYERWNANGDGGGCIRREGDDKVMVDLKGAGVLWRTWSARAGRGHIRIFIDGSEKPIVDKPFNEYFGDYEKEYPGLAMTLSRGRNEFIPIPFARSCKVVVAKGWGMYFHATHTIFPEGTRVEPFAGFTPEIKSMLKKAGQAWLKRGANPHPSAKTAEKKETLAVAPGKTQSLSLAGAGAIRELKVTPLDLPAEKIAREDVMRELAISIFWDGEKSPSVWSPLGDFFATSPGLNPFKTFTTGCIDGTFYSYWYMPFASGARIVLANDGKKARKLKVELETVELNAQAAQKLLRFCAAWHSDDFTGLDAKRFMKRGGDRWPDWPLLVVKGKGRFVGMTEHIWKFGGWWGEGDEKFFIDGEKYPSTIGTGSEDYIGYAWAANRPFITFDSALAAVSRLRPDAQEDTSVCRFHVCDDMPFNRSFQGFIEVMPNGNCRPVLYDTVAYWYRQSGAENPYPVVPIEKRRHRRPGREMRHIMPSTFEVPKPKPPVPGTVEGETMKVIRRASGRIWTQNMHNFRAGGTWSRGHQLIWTGGKKGESIELEFYVDTGGKRELIVVLTKAVDYGITQLAIDGKELGKPIDCYDSKVTTTGEISMGTVELKKGRHLLRATAVGQNKKVRAAGAGGYIFGIDYLRLKK